MNQQGRFGWRRMGASLLLGLAALAQVPAAHAAPWKDADQFANEAFRQVWIATDQPVMQGRTQRSYTWGPRPWFDYYEPYHDAPNGLRQVQYFDKARMEINEPTIAGVRGVTNGLLTVELVSGRLKYGDGIGPEDNMERAPAQVPVAGNPASDNPTAPTYASFRGVATIDNGYRDPDRRGRRVTATIDKAGNRSDNPDFADYAATQIVAYNTITGHNIPRAFRDFMNNSGVDATFAFGYPITDAYWVRARVGADERDVMVQLFERRVLTYTPSNTPSFRVEMGNVGQHYFQWRYPDLGLPWRGIDPGLRSSIMPIAFASKRATPDHWETYFMNRDGITTAEVTRGSAETLPYSWRRTYIETEASGIVNYPHPWRLMTDSRRVDGSRQLFSISQLDFSDVRQHTDHIGGSMAFNGAVSPDGNLIAAAAQNGDLTSISITPFGQERAVIAPRAPIERDCRYESPTWLPNGSGIVFAANCDGKFAIYRGDLRFEGPLAGYGYTLVNVRPISSTPAADNYFPRVSPDGKQIAFASNRNGQGDIYVINIDGSGERRITTDSSDDGAPTWAANGFEIAFDSNRDGDYEIYRTTLDYPGEVVKLTDNTVDDRWPLWEQ
jgi:hypothetical protein